MHTDLEERVLVGNVAGDNLADFFILMYLPLPPSINFLNECSLP